MKQAGSNTSPGLDLGCHGHEGLLHIGGVLSTRFKEWDADFISKCLQDKAGTKKHVKQVIRVGPGTYHLLQLHEAASCSQTPT